MFYLFTYHRGYTPNGLQELLKILRFFKDPIKVPSKRHDHAIVLKEGAEIPNMQLERYPVNIKKTETENQLVMR